ncbi:MAG: hypothetical protein FWD48_07130 [Oscillospiraceae bacterium]|nr:hypothetical protein [Oscillospiraceae bacterium]
MNQLNQRRIPTTFLTVFFLIAAAVAAVIRFVQFAADIVDFDTGFFYYHTGALKHLHYIALAVIGICLIILVIIERKRKTRFFTKRLSHFDDSDTAICGIMLLLASFAVIYTAVGAGLSKLSIAELLTVFLGAAAYAFSGGALLIKKRTFPSVGIAFLMLSGYYVIQLIILFLGNHIILSMSEHLVRLIYTVVLALFYLSAGRMFMRIESKSTRVKACVFGFFAIILAVSEIAAKITFLFGSPSVTRYNLGTTATTFIAPDMLFAAETIVILVFLLTMLKVKHDKQERKSRRKSEKE